MRVDDLRGKRVAIWGFGREGRAAVRFLRASDPEMALTIMDDTAESSGGDLPFIRGRAAIAAAITDFSVVVKSPGISLYDPLVRQAQGSGVRFTSLLNLWFADAPLARTICVTGTKGKSTTAALIDHILRKTGKSAELAGNIGTPVTDLPGAGLDYAVIEVSSYQAADFDGQCDIAVLTMLAQEHLDWHGSIAAYQHDKLNLLRHARHCIANADARASIKDIGNLTLFDPRADLHVGNAYLSRPHNRSNVSAALAVAEHLGLGRTEALRAIEDFRPLPHRQQEIGEIDGRLYVDDSISTTPESAVAALDVYADRAVTIIIGGHDRGIDYQALIDRLRAAPPNAAILLDASGRRLHAELSPMHGVHFVQSMRDAVDLARSVTPPGGVVLLSPAAPSYGRYRDFIERGEDFARCAGLLPHSDVWN
jgi:UDP-N-acetylmuramoylalanine--D-glutamate ligase